MRSTSTWLAAAFAFGLSAPAFADDTDAVAAAEEPPPPPIVLQRVPPRHSWDFALAPSFGMIGYFREDLPAWLGVGIRGGWGAHKGFHRFGVGLSVAAEGEVTVMWTTAIEPAATWDWISPKGLLLGASVGPSLLLHHTLAARAGVSFDTKVGASPHAAFRIGWSQPWSLIGKRFFVAAEPRLRWIRGAPSASIALVIGSGGGY